MCLLCVIVASLFVCSCAVLACLSVPVGVSLAVRWVCLIGKILKSLSYRPMCICLAFCSGIRFPMRLSIVCVWSYAIELRVTTILQVISIFTQNIGKIRETTILQLRNTVSIGVVESHPILGVCRNFFAGFLCRVQISRGM